MNSKSYNVYSQRFAIPLQAPGRLGRHRRIPKADCLRTKRSRRGPSPAINADVALAQALYQALRVSEDDRETLTKQGGPPENFSQRITMRRILGVYGADTENNLNILRHRHIRNAFAHAHVPITFQTREVVAAVGLFRELPLFAPYAVGADKMAVPEFARQVSVNWPMMENQLWHIDSPYFLKKASTPKMLPMRARAKVTRLCMWSQPAFSSARISK